MQSWVETALSSEVYKRRLSFAEWWLQVRHCSATQLIGQLDLASAFDEAGWQVSMSSELSVRAGRSVWLVSLPLSPWRHTSLPLSGIALGSAVTARTTPVFYPPSIQCRRPKTEGAVPTWQPRFPTSPSPCRNRKHHHCLNRPSHTGCQLADLR